MTKKTYFYLFLLFLFVFNTPNHAYDNLNEAVNIAGKQRMLTQRMLKNYILIGIGNRFMQPRSRLIQDISQFDIALNQLQNLQISQKIQQDLTIIRQQWQPIKNRLLQQTPSIEILQQLHQKIDLLLKACHQVTQLIIKVSNTEISEIVSLSGRQRMLSQRMGALYILQISGIEQIEVKKKLKISMVEFSQALTQLSQSKLNSSEIKNHLKQVKKWFHWFEKMTQSETEIYVPSDISKVTNNILYEMDQVTQLYIKIIQFKL